MLKIKLSAVYGRSFTVPSLFLCFKVGIFSYLSGGSFECYKGQSLMGTSGGKQCYREAFKFETIQ